MSAQPVDIQIFGRSLRVNCPPDQRDALNQAADDLNQRLQDLKVRTRVTNTEQLVFIAALNISYELTQEKRRPAITRRAWNNVFGCYNRPSNRRCLIKVA
ncbi:Z-ring-associated protein ZapA [Salmonella enterica subsp. enterica]|uniref:Cell division protein ZapA n=1 Tax=Salmonella enterica I TaxID=59201 RepID=A0A379W3E7_SALET|nr:Z-ring-associated protein ZapA [Salmonella enterica subsp. enterica]